MSFRIEEKIPLPVSESRALINVLKNEGLSDLYPERIISSNYLETKDFDLYRNSEEGTLPRKKIRLRHYPKDENISWRLEKKISSVEGRFKTSYALSDKERQKIKMYGYIDNLYGNLEELINVTYSRKYYLFSDMRITLDTNIIYKDLKQELVEHKEGLSVIEIKATSNVRIDYIKSLINEKTKRFSKYCNGIKSLYYQLS
jgi:hypothetical protein